MSPGNRLAGYSKAREAAWSRQMIFPSFPAAVLATKTRPSISCGTANASPAWCGRFFLDVTQGLPPELRYLRDSDRREVDFVRNAQG